MGWSKQHLPVRRALFGRQPARLSRVVTGHCAHPYLLLFLTAPACPLHLRSEDCLHGVCAAHAAALQTVVQTQEGVSSCYDSQLHIAADLHSICDACGVLLTDASLVALFSDTIVRLTLNLAEVSWPFLHVLLWQIRRMDS